MINKSSLLLCFLFTSCSLSQLIGPLYETRYSYEEAKNQSQRNCLVHCQTAKSQCNVMCELDKKKCEREAERDYLAAYSQCESDVVAGIKQLYQCPSRSQFNYHCENNCRCIEHYNQCYQTCGLKVTSKKVCVANCEEN